LYSDTATNHTHIYTQGVYTVTLVAGNHYCTDSFKATDSLIHELHAAFVDSPFIYCQDSLVTLTNITNDTNDIITGYKWLFGDGSTSTAFSTTHVYKNSGVYNIQLVATDFIPCHDTASLKFYIDSTTAMSMSVTDSVICRSSYITFTGNYTTIGNIGNVWSFGDGDSMKNINPVSHAYDVAGTYTVTLTSHYRACRDTSVSRKFTIFPVPSVNLGGNATICPGSNAIAIGDTINQPNAQTRWLWNTGETTPSIDVVEPGHYAVTVTINGCSSTDTIWVQNDCYMNIPNVFTPNGDGMNDYFFPRQYLTRGLTQFSMNIYNRWGQLIFEANTLDGSGWDGRFNGVAQPEGVYVYVIDAKFKDGQKEHHQGNITLLR
jgi:gliding motility-associated-like protein